jgi:hypothetical protein
VYRSWSSLVVSVTVLQVGQAGVHIQEEARDFWLLQYVQPGCGANPAFCSVWVLSWGVKELGHEVNHIVFSLRMSGALLLLPLCACTLWTGKTVCLLVLCIVSSLIYLSSQSLNCCCHSGKVCVRTAGRGCCLDVSCHSASRVTYSCNDWNNYRKFIQKFALEVWRIRWLFL